MARNTVTVRILGDSSDYERAVGSADSASGRLGGVFGKVASFASTAAVGIGGATLAAAGFGLKTAGSMEQAQIGFETMLGSAEKARSFLGELQAFAAKTPFEFPELQTAASSLISAGFEAKKVVPIMTTLGNVTSGMGTGAEGVKRATVALQQMAAAGRITGEDLNQLRDAGIPVFDLLAAATGKTKEEVAALAQSGKLGKEEMNALFKALETGKGLERFNGLMEKQSKSLFGLLSTLKDSVSMGLAGAMKPFVGILGEVLPKVSAVSDRAMKRLTSGMNEFFDAFENFREVGAWEAHGPFEKLGVAVANVVREAPKLAGAFRVGDMQGVAETVDKMLGGTGALVGPIREVGNAAKSLWTIFRDGMLPVLVGFTEALPSFLTPLGLVNVALGFMADHAEALRPIMAALLGGFLAYKAVTTAVAGAQAVLNAGVLAYKAVTTAVAGAQAVLNAVMSANPIGLVVIAIAALVAGLVWAYNNVDGFRSGVQTAFRAIAGAASWLGDAFAATWQGIVAGFGWVRDTLKSIANWLIRNVVNKVIDGVNTLLKGYNAIPDVLRGGANDVALLQHVPVLHQGGVFRAPTPGGEGLALLRDRETVMPAGASGGGDGGGMSVVLNTGPIVGADERALEELMVRVLAKYFGRGGTLTDRKGASLVFA